METAAKTEHGLAQLPTRTWGDPALPCCRRGCGPTPAPALPSMRSRRPSEICPVPFAAQSDPQALLHDIGGDRSVVSVDQRVLVDLLCRDGALGDSTKTLLTRSFTCLVAANGFMNMKTAPLWIALSISRSSTRRFGAPMTMAASSCIAGVCCWWYATAVAAAMLTNPINQAGRAKPSVLTECGQDVTRTFGSRRRNLEVVPRPSRCTRNFAL